MGETKQGLLPMHEQSNDQIGQYEAKLYMETRAATFWLAGRYPIYVKKQNLQIS